MHNYCEDLGVCSEPSLLYMHEPIDLCCTWVWRPYLIKKCLVCTGFFNVLPEGHYSADVYEAEGRVNRLYIHRGLLRHFSI